MATASGFVPSRRVVYGSSRQVELRQFGPGMVQQVQRHCDSCGGSGQSIKDKDRCKTCNGKKVMPERKVLEVHIDKGMEDGQRITFNGEADQQPGLPPGDIVIVLEEKEHPLFKRRGNDLLMEMVWMCVLVLPQVILFRALPWPRRCAASRRL